MINVLICKEGMNKLIPSQTRILDETSTIKYSIIQAEKITQRTGFTGAYVWNETTQTLDVVYTEKPKTELQLMETRLAELEQANAELLLLLAGGVE